MRVPQLSTSQRGRFNSLLGRALISDQFVTHRKHSNLSSKGG